MNDKAGVTMTLYCSNCYKGFHYTQRQQTHYSWRQRRIAVVHAARDCGWHVYGDHVLCTDCKAHCRPASVRYLLRHGRAMIKGQIITNACAKCGGRNTSEYTVCSRCRARALLHDYPRGVRMVSEGSRPRTCVG